MTSERRGNTPLFCTTFLRQIGKIRKNTTFYDVQLYAKRQHKYIHNT